MIIMTNIFKSVSI